MNFTTASRLAKMNSDAAGARWILFRKTTFFVCIDEKAMERATVLLKMASISFCFVAQAKFVCKSSRFKGKFAYIDVC